MLQALMKVLVLQALKSVLEPIFGPREGWSLKFKWNTLKFGHAASAASRSSCTSLTVA